MSGARESEDPYQDLFLDAEDDIDEDDDDFEPVDTEEDAEEDDGLMGDIFEEDDDEFHGVNEPFSSGRVRRLT